MSEDCTVVVRERLGSYHAEGPPSRLLVVPCYIENRSRSPLVMMSAWVEATFSPGGLAVSGHYLAQLHAKARGATVKPGRELHCEFRIPVSAELLNSVERERKQESVQLSLKNQVLLAPVIKGHASSGKASRDLCLAPPWGLEIGDEKGRATLIIDLVQSEWLNLLSAWRWSEVELFELGLDIGREGPMYRRAFEHVRGAEERFRRQDFPGTLQECRLVFESMGLDAAPGSDTKTGMNALITTRVLGERKQAAFDQLLFELGQLCHLGRHEKGIQEVITRGEALFTLRATLAALQMLAGT